MKARRRCGLLALCLLIVLLSAMPASGRWGASRAVASSQPAPPAEIVVAGIMPKAPGPESEVEIHGRVTNTSSEPLEDVSVRLRFSANPLVTRTQLTRYAEGLSPARAFPRSRTQRQVAAELAPDESATWRIKVRVADLGLSRFGVYPLGVEALDGRPHQLATVRTFLPFVPDGSRRPQPTKITWLWPVIDRPHRITDRTYLDDELADQFSASGRLGRLVSAAQDAPAPDGRDRLPLVYAVDPQLLEDARLLSDEYEVRQDGETRRREASEAAATWLEDIRSVTADSTVLAVPYADPDMTALTHAGLDDNLTFAVTRGEALAAELLGRDVARDVAWPPGGMLDQDTLDNLVVAGTRTVILSDAAIPPAPALTYTPDAAATAPTIGGDAQVAVADSTLSEIVGRDSWSPGEAVLTEQRFLAETALITAERPNQPRTVLVAPPRRWNPPPDLASALLADSSQVPWLEPVSLSELTAASEPVPRGPLQYPQSARQQELGSQFQDDVRSIHRDVERLTSVVTSQSSAFHLALARTESSAWRDSKQLGGTFRGAVRDALDQQLDQVKILSRGPRTLASTTGTVPVTIGNELEEHSVTVGVRVTPRSRARLEVGDYENEVTVGAGRKETIQVPMTARATGVTTVELQLVTADGEPYGEAVDLSIRATGYGTVALVITGSAFAVLFLALGVRLVRRALNEDDAGGSGGSAEDDAGTIADNPPTADGAPGTRPDGDAPTDGDDVGDQDGRQGH